MVVDCLGEELFAGPGLPEDKHRRVAPGKTSNLLNLQPDGFASANNLREGALPGQSIGDLLKLNSALAPYPFGTRHWPTPLEIATLAHGYAPNKRASLSYSLKNFFTINPGFHSACTLTSRLRAVLGSSEHERGAREVCCLPATGW